jgi:prophage antirepressor-like protein
MTAPAMLAFHFEDSQLRAFDHEGEAWFVAQDVCAMLGLGNPTRALSNLDEDEKGLTTSNTLGGFQQLLIVSESGLYAMIFRSRKPVAKRIRKWVTQEVLPTIRKTGRYELPANDDQKGVGIADTLGLDSPDDIERMRVKIALIREARHAYGPKSARGLWEAIGLPDVQRIEMPPGTLTADDLDPGIRDWIEARCTLDTACRTKSMALYNDYRDWCGERGEMPLSQNTFGRQLTTAGLRAFHSNVTWRRGIRLKD